MSKNAKYHAILIGLTTALLVLRYNNKIFIENPFVREFILIAACIGIMLLFINSFYLKQLFPKILSGLVFGLLSLICTLVLFFSVMQIESLIEWDGKDYTLEAIQEIQHNERKIKVYRTDGGATTAFGIIIQEEKQIAPGILLIDELFNQYRLDTIGIKLITGNKLQVFDTRKGNKLIKEINLQD